MAKTAPDVGELLQRPKRADARRNHDKLLTAAREAFAQDGTDASLEDVARRAEVGIGTLYRHFPTRQHLLEAVYIDEVQAVTRAADELSGLPPWDALATWLRDFVRFAATKRAVSEELLNYVDRDSTVFSGCRHEVLDAGGRLLERAQQAGVARRDTNFQDVGRMISAIAAMRTSDPGQVERVLEIALDGLRTVPPAG